MKQSVLLRQVGWKTENLITVLGDKQPHKIRLYGIDCPEKRQPFGTKAKQFTSDMVFGKTVVISNYDISKSCAAVVPDGFQCQYHRDMPDDRAEGLG